jgi:hypothetical protein
MITLTSTQYEVNYQMKGNKWFLTNIREDLSFYIRKKLSLFHSMYHSTAEFVVTRVDSCNVHRFKNLQLIGNNDIFADKLGTYDPVFWEDFNFIKPEESLMKALEKSPIKNNHSF